MTDEIDDACPSIFLDSDELKQFIDELNKIYLKIETFENKLKEVSNG